MAKVQMIFEFTPIEDNEEELVNQLEDVFNETLGLLRNESRGVKGTCESLDKLSEKIDEHLAKVDAATAHIDELLVEEDDDTESLGTVFDTLLVEEIIRRARA